MRDTLKNRRESLMHLRNAEGSCSRRCIQFTRHAVFLSLPLIGIDAAPNQGEHYRSAKELEMTRFTERQSSLSSVHFLYTDKRIVQQKGKTAKVTALVVFIWTTKHLTVYKVPFFRGLQCLSSLAVCEPWVLTMLSQIQVSEWLQKSLTELFNGWSLNIIGGESWKHILWQPLAQEVWKHGLS